LTLRILIKKHSGVNWQPGSYCVSYDLGGSNKKYHVVQSTSMKPQLLENARIHAFCLCTKIGCIYLKVTVNSNLHIAGIRITQPLATPGNINDATKSMERITRFNGTRICGATPHTRLGLHILRSYRY
jgi:hypothetical protein